MIWIIVAIIGIAGLTSLFDTNPDRTMNEYCKLECKESKIRDCSICC